MYSLQDLIDLANDVLLPELTRIHASFALHIKTDCEVGTCAPTLVTQTLVVMIHNILQQSLAIEHFPLPDPYEHVY